MDGKLAVIGLGSIGSMALWQASRLTDSVTGFEAQSPAHGRSAVGGDTRLFRMIYRGVPDLYPILERSRDLWAELEAETGQDISPAAAACPSAPPTAPTSAASWKLPEPTGPPTNSSAAKRWHNATRSTTSARMTAPFTTRTPGFYAPTVPSQPPSPQPRPTAQPSTPTPLSTASPKPKTASSSPPGEVLDLRERHRLLRRLVPAP